MRRTTRSTRHVAAAASCPGHAEDGSFVRVGGQELRKVNTRLISAASKNLRQLTDEGSFRLDFYFRINAVTIELPPLRNEAWICRC